MVLGVEGELVRAAVGFLCDATAEALYDAVVDPSNEEVVGLEAAKVETAHEASYDKLQASLASVFQLSSPRPPSASRATACAPGDSRPYHATQQPARRVGPATSWCSLYLGGLSVEGPLKCRSDRY